MLREKSMNMRSLMQRGIAVLSLLWLAACTPLPQSPQDIEAKQFRAVPDKAVVYLFRDAPDFADDAATVLVNDSVQGTTFPGTYLRIELGAGKHRVSGFAFDSGIIEFEARPGSIYFLQQSVARSFSRTHNSRFRFVGERYGREAVLRAELVGAGI
jgi:hypothetical protein